MSMPEIHVVDADPTWPAAFQAIGAALRGALGDHALAIHHIGSTSVPGLAAKPVIDVQVTVASLDAPLEGALRALGYDLRPPREDHLPPGLTLADAELAKRMYRSMRPRVNLHVRVAGRYNQRYPLLFRDYLRAVPDAAAAYGAMKRALARYFPDDVVGYYAIKDPGCDLIMAGAEAWAARTGWAAGPTDA